MGTKSKKKYKLLSLLLAFALVLTTCLPMSSMAAAESTDCVTVSSTAKTTGETVAGAKYEVELSKIFTDSDNHSLTYMLESTDLGGYTQIKDGILYFTENKAGDYEVKVKATCSSGKSALYTLKMTVKAAEEGTKDQYNYNETDADKVTVWVTMSNDGVPLMGNDDGNTKLSHVKVTVPYFDLGKYRLDRFKRCHTAVDPNMGHKGAYIDTVAVERPTYFHLLIWLTERYYLGLPEERCGKGTSGVFENTDTTTVNTIFGEKAYTSNGLGAFELKDGTATATSMLINNLWGHDMNFMYLRNHVYPLMDAGWGATADYILLSDDDVLDIALFTDWTFYQRGSFNKFDKEVYTAAPGADMTFSTLKYDTVSPSDGGAGTFTKMDKLNIGLYNADWEKVSDVNIDGVDGEYYIDALPVVEGTYYLLGLDPLVGTKNSYTACYAPAVAEVDIKGENPYEGMPFTDIYYMDGDTKVQLKKIAQEDSLNSSGYPDFKNLPAYKVTIPESLVGTTPTVYVTIPLKDGKKLSSSIYTYSRTTGGGYGSDSYTVTNDGNNYTIALKVTDTYIGDAADYMVPEVNSSWEAVVGLTFVGGNIGDESEDPFKDAPFTDLYYMDGEKKVQLPVFEKEEEGLSDSNMQMSNVPAYKVTVPESLADTGLDVYITYPDTQTLVKYAYLYKNGAVDYMTYPGPTVAVDAETNTLKITVTKDYIDANGTYVLAEDCLLYTSYKGINDANVSNLKVTDDESGILKITGYGEDRTVGIDNILLTFTGKAAGESNITVTAAKIDKSAHATADAPDAQILNASCNVTVENIHRVTLTGEIHGASTVKDGTEYRIDLNDQHYDYEITAKMNGQTVTAEKKTDASGDVYYSIGNVTGDLDVTATRTPKTYTITTDGTGKEDLTAAGSATYLQAYTFTVDKKYGYTYLVTVKKNGEDCPVSMDADQKTYTIAGTNVTGDIQITVSKEVDMSTRTKINFTGNGSGNVTGGTTQLAMRNQEFAFEMTATDVYEYTLKLADGTVLTPEADGKTYKIPASKVTGEELNVTAERKGIITQTVSKYLDLGDEKAIWLLTASGAVDDGNILTYDTHSMYWSTNYQAYAYLLISDKSQSEVEAEAAGKVQEAAGTKQTLAYDYDVNGTKIVDINDVQLIYNMYNAMYENFDMATMEKFLNADVNNDRKVNVLDASQAVQEMIKRNK